MNNHDGPRLFRDWGIEDVASGSSARTRARAHGRLDLSGCWQATSVSGPAGLAVGSVGPIRDAMTEERVEERVSLKPCLASAASRSTPLLTMDQPGAAHERVSMNITGTVFDGSTGALIAGQRRSFPALAQAEGQRASRTEPLAS